jgi:hypothetical protein
MDPNGGYTCHWPELQSPNRAPDQEVLPFPDREPEKTAILKTNTKLFNKVNN